MNTGNATTQRSFKSDVWSLGITIVEMLTRKEPYGDMPLAQVLYGLASHTLLPTLVRYLLACLTCSFSDAVTVH